MSTTYKVTYKVGNTTASRTMSLRGGTESEAISKLRSNYAVPKGADIIILRIEKA